ncbi:hypothetical protein GCM10029976_019880 [Kribbella albertanoniae]
MPDPVFAPEMPPDDRDKLLKHPGAMVLASLPTPKPRSGLRSASRSSLALLAGTLVLDIVLTIVIGGYLFEVLPKAPAGWATAGVAAIGLVAFWFNLRDASKSSPESEAAIKYHGKYLQAADWDADAQQLMLRAQAAVQAVGSAEVTRRGLLDDIQNDVVLPEQLWDIGQILQKLTVLRSRHREIDAAAASVLSETVTRQAEALRRTEAAMERKVATLEKYADQVRSADALLRAERAAEQVRKDDDAYVELLASAEPAAGTALIQDLSEDAIDLHQQLALRLAAIRETGQALTPSPEA